MTSAVEIQVAAAANGYKPLSELQSPINRLALAYWQKVRGDRTMPSRSDIDPMDIKAALPCIFLLDVQHSPLDFRYRLIGTMMAEHMTADYTGKWMRAIEHQAPPSRIWSACEAVAVGREPLSSNTPYVGRHSDLKRTEDLIMPLSNDDRTVHMLFVTADFL